MRGNKNQITKPKPYQVEGAKIINKKFKGRALLADDMGLGKTFTSLYYCHKAQKEKVVVVCPSVAKMVWKQQALEHFGFTAHILEGTKPPHDNAFNLAAPITIINYDILKYWLPYLKKLAPDMIVFDECHYLKNADSGRTQASKLLVQGVKTVIALSGTPMEDRPKDLWPVLNILRPDRFANFGSFAFKFCNPTKEYGKWQYNGATNKKELHGLLKETVMLRRTKAKVLKDLPPKVRTAIPIQLKPKDRKEYDRISADFIGHIRETKPHLLAKYKENERLLRLNYLKKLAAQKKFKMALEWVDDFLRSTDEKIILFTYHTGAAQALIKKYKDISVNVTGSTPKRQRESAEFTFQNNPKIRIFVGQIKAAGVALTLTKATNVAFLELVYTPSQIIQAEDRAHRLGQLSSVNVYYLVAVRTVEERMGQILAGKNKNIKQTIDGDFTDKDIELKILEYLEK